MPRRKEAEEEQKQKVLEEEFFCKANSFSATAAAAGDGMILSRLC
jgi:hypothetical protein